MVIPILFMRQRLEAQAALPVVLYIQLVKEAPPGRRSRRFSTFDPRRHTDPSGYRTNLSRAIVESTIENDYDVVTRLCPQVLACKRYIRRFATIGRESPCLLRWVQWLPRGHRSIVSQLFYRKR